MNDFLAQEARNDVAFESIDNLEASNLRVGEREHARTFLPHLPTPLFPLSAPARILVFEVSSIFPLSAPARIFIRGILNLSP